MAILDARPLWILRVRRVPLALAAATVLLGGFAVWAHQQAQALTADPSARNTALTDNARTSEVKGEIASAVNTIFSYDYTDVGRTDRAAHAFLTGKAVEEYNAMFAVIRLQAPAQQLVLTTTVTDSAVKTIEGDRARLLLFADQRSTRASDGQSSYAAAMLAVDAVRRSGHWKITNLDAFAAPR